MISYHTQTAHANHNNSSPESAVPLQQLRQGIDKADNQIQTLLQERLSMALAVAQTKKNTHGQEDLGLSRLFDPVREQRIIRTLQDRTHPQYRDILTDIWWRLMAFSLASQTRDGVIPIALWTSWRTPRSAYEALASRFGIVARMVRLAPLAIQSLLQTGEDPYIGSRGGLVAVAADDGDSYTGQAWWRYLPLSWQVVACLPLPHRLSPVLLLARLEPGLSGQPFSSGQTVVVVKPDDSAVDTIPFVEIARQQGQRLGLVDLADAGALGRARILGQIP